MFQVDKGNHDKGRAEEEQDEKGHGGAELCKEKEGQEAVDQFYRRILGRNAGLAGTALPTQGNIAQQRDIVVPADPVITLQAVGRREYNGFLLRQPINADIEKRADHSAEDEGEYIENER
jgi:hypothetical protein